MYETVVKTYKIYCIMDEVEQHAVPSVRLWLTYLHERHKAASTIFSWYSVVKTYFLYHVKNVNGSPVNLNVEAPDLQKLIMQWSKMENVKQAKVR